MTRAGILRGLVFVAGFMLVAGFGHVAKDNLRFCFQSAVLAHPASAAPRQTIRVVGRIEHNRNAFTQGLAARGNVVWESTGLEGQSQVRRLDATTGQVLAERDLPPAVFGEGLTPVGDRLHVLTWTHSLAYVFDAETLLPLRRHAVPNPAWGLVYDGQRLIMSDGSTILRYLDPADGREIGQLVVRDGEYPVLNLNELERVGDEIWANVWHTDSIVRIRRDNGQVAGWIDLEGCACRPWIRRTSDTLNGIAFEPLTRTLYLTGKRWPFILKAELIDKTTP